MPVRLQCPACSAPLTLPDTHATTASCPYCGAAVLLTERHGKVEAVEVGPPARPASRTPLFIGCAAVLVAVAAGAGALIAGRDAEPEGVRFDVNVEVPTPAGIAAPAAEPPRPPEPPAFAEPVLEFGSEGTGAGRFTDARGVAVDGQGRIYVAEYSGGRVQVFDSAGVFLTQWTADPKMPLVDLEADRRGTVYVVQSGRIRRYEGATGKLLGTVPGSGGSYTVSDVALALDGSMWAVTWPHGIVHLGADGEELRSIDAREAIGESASPERVAVSGTGDLYVLDQWAADVYHLDRTGKLVDRFGGKGDGPTGFSSPADLAVDGRGRVFVSDLGGGIRVYSPEGGLLGSFGPGVVFGIGLTDRDEVLAAYRNKYQVVKFRLRE
jgi:DNA-directed RNA polymerase subunit RPC12/RpoP